MAEFYKVTNGEETHYGFEYHDGLNELAEPFNDDPNFLCGAGGLYFTDLKNINRFYSYGTNIREIFLPKNDPDFKMVQIAEESKWRANKIILGKKYSLFDDETYRILGLNIRENESILFFAAKYQNIEFLDSHKKLFIIFWKYNRESMLPIIIDNDLIHTANWLCKNGIESYKEFSSQISFRRQISDITIASENSNIDKLDWWKKSAPHLLSISIDITTHILNLNHEMVIWWLNNAIGPLKYATFIPIFLKKLEQDMVESLTDDEKYCTIEKIFSELAHFFINYDLSPDIDSIFLIFADFLEKQLIKIYKMVKTIFPKWTLPKNDILLAIKNKYIKLLDWFGDNGYSKHLFCDEVLYLIFKLEDTDLLNWLAKHKEKINFPDDFSWWITNHCDANMIGEFCSLSRS